MPNDHLVRKNKAAINFDFIYPLVEEVSIQLFSFVLRNSLFQ
ncbi:MULTISPECIES: hypothetical protein [Bacillaceae]|nr:MULTISPECIES: hypothetical protein [Bacillaceae]